MAVDILGFARFKRSGFAWLRAEMVVTIVDVYFDPFFALIFDRKLRARSSVYCEQGAGRRGE